MRRQPDRLAAAARDLPPAAGPRHQILFQPTFHAPALLTVDLGPAPRVHLRAYADSPWPEASAGGPLPAHTDARADLAPARAAQARLDLERHAATLALPDDRQGRDGITLDVALTADAGAEPRRFAAWSPERTMPVHAYFAAAHALACEALDGEARRRLEQIHGYLDLGLSARDRGGYPRDLQIFGHLSSSDGPALVALFAAVAPSLAVVVDMRTFEAMGAALYPVFRRFAARPGPLAWAVSPAARRQLREAGVPSNQLRDDHADAVLLAVVRDAAR